MGAANVIPGVSGGTIAFITNVYDELIHSLKSLDLKAIRLLFSGRFSELSRHVNLGFLFFLFSGVAISIISLGKLLSFLFDFYPIYVWAYFFGLIIASVYYVGRTIKYWHPGTFLALVVGTISALAIAYLNPASQNDNLLYLIICGVVAMASMLLPGLSGSFVLILMGNYQLIFLEAIPDFNIRIILPVVFGSIIGFVFLSRIIAYLLDRYRDFTIALLTGFILGSLLIIWPWKEPVYLKDTNGMLITKEGQYVVESYHWFMPSFLSSETWLAILFITIGMLTVIMIEKTAKKQNL